MFALVLPAAGSGTRFGGGDKLMVELSGETVLRRSVRAFASRADVAQLVIIAAAERMELYRRHLTDIAGDRLVLVPGGRERWESVLFGLRAVRADIPFVAVHDAARPLVGQDVIDAAFAGARQVGGSVPVVAEPATLKRVGADGRVTATVSRSGLYQAQTPQCFNRATLLAAYETLLATNQLADVTDDAQVFERSGHAVAATAGSVRNMKVTSAQDVHLAEAILALGTQD